MKVTNGIKIAMANKPLCYKILFSRTLISSIFTIICLLVAKIAIDDITSSPQFKALVDSLRAILKNFIAVNDGANVNAGELISANVSAIWEFVKSDIEKVLTVGLIILGVIQLAKFFTGICDYVAAVNVNAHMSSLHHAKFFSTLIEHFSPAIRYATYCVISLLLYNTFIIVTAFLLFTLFFSFAGVFAFTLALFYILFADAFRLMIVGLVPAKMVCEGSSATAAFKQGFKGVEFRLMVERFIAYFTMRLLAIVVTVIAGVVTFGVSLIVTIPLISVSYIAVRFVDYYTINTKKYYINFDNIVVPKGLRTKGEQLLSHVDVDA